MPAIQGKNQITCKSYTNFNITQKLFDVSIQNQVANVEEGKMELTNLISSKKSHLLEIYSYLN